MVTIKVQSSPQNAARYFKEHLSHDDYYSDRQQTVGRWFGRECEPLGIDGHAPVEQKDFVSLCKGLRPDDGTRLTQRTVSNRRCLYDLTISAPKSLSILALVAGDERLIAAHERAVAATLKAAEELAAVRVRKGEACDTRQSRQTGNIVCAQFLHRESRALDPQLHTHCVVFNVTLDPADNRLKALEARPLYESAKRLTGLYRQHLTESLHALGYDTYRDKHRCVQIHGVTAEIMARFSKRSAQRDALAAAKQKELGRPLRKREVASLVHENRGKKQHHIDPQSLRKAQLEQLAPEDQLKLEHLTAQASANLRSGQDRSAIPNRQSRFSPGPEAGWITALRLALLASRALNLNPYLFSPAVSFPQRVFHAARFLRQVQRTTGVLRYAQVGRGKGIGR